MTQQAIDVMIVGGTGFIGRRLTDRLRHVQQEASAPAWSGHVISLSSRDCNLLNSQQSREKLATTSSTTTIIMCAGISRRAGDSWSLFQTNLTMVHNLLRALRDREPRSIVFLSSTDVYGLPTTELPLTETSLPRPTTYYGLAKLACENMFHIGSSPSCPVTILRLPGIYGSTDAGRSIVGSFCRRLSAQQAVQLSGGGYVTRDFVHVDDLCSLMEARVVSPLQTTLNVATGNSMMVADVASRVAQQLQLPAAVAADLLAATPRTSDRDHDLAFDPQLLRTSFPHISLRTIAAGIQAYLEELPQVS